MKIVFIGIVILCVWYFFFYNPPSEIDKLVSSLNADFTHFLFEKSNVAMRIFTPLGISNAQSATPLSFITADEVGVLNVQRCNAQRYKESFISSSSMPDTEDIKKFYNRARDLSDNLAYAEEKIAEMNESMNQKQFDVAASEASKILEANQRRVELGTLTSTIQQSYVENTAALNKLMDDYKAYIGTNTEKLKVMAETSIPIYLLRNNYVKGIQPVRDGLAEIHTKIRKFLEKNEIMVAPLRTDLLNMKKT